MIKSSPELAISSHSKSIYEPETTFRKRTPLAPLLKPDSTSEFQGMEGAFSALFTPFDRSDRIDVGMIERLVEHQLESGIRGFYVTGSTGECLLLSGEERKRVAESVVRFNRGRAKVVVQVGHVSTVAAIELARHAADCGADWISSVGPVYFGQTFEAAYGHYKAIAESTDLPFMIYSFGQTLVPERDIRFFDIPNIKGMKYTGIDFYALQQLTVRIDKPVRIFAGSDQLLAAALIMGCCHGGIGTTYNIIPKHFAGICSAVERSDLRTATRLQYEANRALELMLRGGNGLSVSKAVMRVIGFDCGQCRMPNPPVSEQEYDNLAAQWKQLGIS